MTISAKIDASSNISASVGSSRNIISNVTPAGEAKVVAVTVPGPKGDSGQIIGASTLGIGNLTDTDISNIADGSILQYSSSSGKWVAKNDLDTATGTITLSGGNF